MSTDTPSDAPLGPIVRYLAKAVRWAAIGDERTHGGALGADWPSPRLQGWLESCGIPTVELGRTIDGATRWATASPSELKSEASQRVKRTNKRNKDALRPLLRTIYDLGRSEVLNDGSTKNPAMTKKFLLEQAVENLQDPDPELDAGIAAQKILDRGFDPYSLPMASTLAEEPHWFGRETIEQMIAVPESGSGT